MRALFFAFVVLVASSARAAEASLPAGSETCLECHKAGGDGPEVNVPDFASSVHAQNGVGCADCHEGYTPEHAMGGTLPALSPEQQGTVDRLAKGTWGEGAEKQSVTAPRAYLACGNCHADATEAFAGSIHSKWLREDTKVPGPTCASCHGSPHGVKKLAAYVPAPDPRQPVPADRREIAKRCESCHGNPEFAKAAGMNPDTAATYHDSIHGRLVRVGNELAPACTSCHAADGKGGTHAIVAKTDPASVVHEANRKNACARCHEGATDNFAALIAHKPPQETGGHPVPHIVHIAFSWLTTLTLVFFAFHVLIDFIYELRERLKAKHGHGPSVDAVRSVIRFDIHQRIQHWFMLSGVILLGLTGWPLRGAGTFGDAPILGGQDAAPYSQAFMKLFGGAEGAALWHRVGAVLIIIASVYHLFYLTFLAAQKRLPLSMLPAPKDALDMRDNILFMLGLKKDRPKFDRYMYLEKFDYWAVFWGMVMMVATGFIFWFPAFFANWAPSWLITAALIIHGEEATLAIVFLFVVHFYNVHLKPSIFPMNWAWLNGRITVETLKHEHPLEYERMKSDQDR
jgi:cytochrome b subunit of formate dehydrogenase/nitrate/TMAO reductase-like tetraheme cytochrome c subunit